MVCFSFFHHVPFITSISTIWLQSVTTVVPWHVAHGQSQAVCNARVQDAQHPVPPWAGAERCLVGVNVLIVLLNSLC